MNLSYKLVRIGSFVAAEVVYYVVVGLGTNKIFKASINGAKTLRVLAKAYSRTNNNSTVIFEDAIDAVHDAY